MIIPALILILLLNKKTGIGDLKTSKFYPVYLNGKINKQLRLKPTGQQKGVYILKKGTEIKYIGYSGSNIYKTLTRHFQSWQDRSQIRITYGQNSGIKARIIYTPTATQAARLEKALILKYKPSDNPNKYEQYSLNLNDEKILTNYESSADAPF